MAITGLLLFGFVVGHLLGNLTIFIGPDAINAYAKKLKSLGPGLWVMRFGLLAIVGLHIFTAIRITLENRAARPIGYAQKKNVETTYAARTMMLSGFIVLAYIIYHLLHFTVQVVHSDYAQHTDAMGRHDVYSMVVLSFQQPLITLVYIVAMALLCFHLSHGISSLLQSLGLTNEKRIPLFKKIGIAISVLIFIGYASIPASVLLGIVKPVEGL